MNPQDISTNGRESLSALLDGELGGEARRFAMRRLAHDTEWQQATGRWQMIGDAMRRQAPIAAPAGFAERVRDAIAVDAQVQAAPATGLATTPVAASRRSRRVYGWAGGALAASVALAAVIGLRPQAPDAPQAPPPAIASSASAAPVVPATAPSGAAGDVVPTVAAIEPERPAAAPAPTPAESRAPVRAVAATRGVRASASPRRPTSPADVPAVASTAAMPVLVADADNPFRLKPADDIAARPWPRAALTGASDGAFTARYGARGQSAADAPSFYPFEPRLEGADATTLPSPTP